MFFTLAPPPLTVCRRSAWPSRRPTSTTPSSTPTNTGPHLPAEMAAPARAGIGIATTPTPASTRITSTATGSWPVTLQRRRTTQQPRRMPAPFTLIEAPLAPSPDRCGADRHRRPVPGFILESRRGLLRPEGRQPAPGNRLGMDAGPGELDQRRSDAKHSHSS